MPKFKDLSGQKFNKLTVIDRAPNRGCSTMWNVICECGTKNIVGANQLTTNSTKSCGCLRSARLVNLDFTGQRFGRLTVLESHPKSYYNNHRSFVQCDCGIRKEVKSVDLKSGHIKSCGCLKRELDQARLTDLIGKRFGKLTVTKRAPNYISNGKKRTAYYALCDCGKETKTLAHRLANGLTKSCGCLVSEAGHKRRGIYKTEPGQTGLNLKYKQYINGAKKRNIQFELTIEDFQKLTQMNCHYDGSPPKHVTKQSNTISNYPEAEAHGVYISNGLDRIDNTKGYTLENVVPCCKICNYAKHSLSQKEWEEWVERFVNFQNKKTN